MGCVFQYLFNKLHVKTLRIGAELVEMIIIWWAIFVYIFHSESGHYPSVRQGSAISSPKTDDAVEPKTRERRKPGSRQAGCCGYAPAVKLSPAENEMLSD